MHHVSWCPQYLWYYNTRLKYFLSANLLLHSTVKLLTVAFTTVLYRKCCTIWFSLFIMSKFKELPHVFHKLFRERKLLKIKYEILAIHLRIQHRSLPLLQHVRVQPPEKPFSRQRLDGHRQHPRAQRGPGLQTLPRSARAPGPRRPLQRPTGDTSTERLVLWTTQQASLLRSLVK